MLMLEQCRLRLVGNSDSDGWGGPHGRRGGGGLAPMPIRKPDAPVVTDPAAVAHGVVARKRWNVSNLLTIPSVDLMEDRSPHPGPRRCERSDWEKAENEANRELHTMIPHQDFGHDGPALARKAKPIPRRFIAAESPRGRPVLVGPATMARGAGVAAKGPRSDLWRSF